MNNTVMPTSTNYLKVTTDNVGVGLDPKRKRETGVLQIVTASPGDAVINDGGDYCNESVIALTVIKKLGRWSTTAFDYYVR